MMKNTFPESQLAHKWLDGLCGIEIGPSSHNPFGLNTRNVGLIDSVYEHEQQTLTGKVSKLDVIAAAESIPLPSESEDFILSSHVIEHCPNMIRALVEWYRILKPEGILYLVTPHRDAAPSDRGRPVTTWEHLVSDYLVNMTSEGEPEVGEFLHCHYHVFDSVAMKEHFQNIFGARMELLDFQEVDDKIGNGFVLVYKKVVPLRKAFPWKFEANNHRAYVSRPADFYVLQEDKVAEASTNRDIVEVSDPDQGTRETTNVRPQKVGNERPLVSAIMTVYQAERFMRGAFEDLLAQTIADQVEIIVVDTDSPEREQDIARQFQEKHPNIVYIRTGFRQSPPEAFNHGLRYARGKYITYANSDDRHRLDAFEVMVGELEANPDVVLVYGDVWVTRFENQTFGDHIRTGYHIRPEFSKDIMLSGCHMGPQPMWRAAVHQNVGVFDGTLDSAADYEFWCRLAVKHHFKHIPQFLGLYYDNPNGMVNSNQRKSREQTLAIQRKYAGTFPPPPQPFIDNYQYSGPIEKGKFVNIGMVTFNRLDFTKAALTSLFKHTCFPHVITVVDNGSTDGTPAYLTELHRQGFITNLILLPENVGVAKASNLAWSLVPDADYYLKLDNDIVIQKPGWLEKMVDAIDTIPELGAVAYNFEPVGYPLCQMHGLGVRPKNGNVNGACVLIPKRTHQLLGFWCEEYGLYGEEDADYGRRIQFQGLQNAYLEDEYIGVHLPAGRAAVIDERTLLARDGIEENIHGDYRAFKDSCRKHNVHGLFYQRIQGYQSGRVPLFCDSNFVREFSKPACSIRDYSHSKGTPNGDDARLKESFAEPNSTSSNGVKSRRVSVIISDSICGRVRLVQPFTAGMGIWEAGTILCDAQLYMGEAPPPAGPEEVWICQRTCILDLTFLARVKSQKTRLIFDCDDLLWDIPPDNFNHGVMTPDKVAKMFRVMALADVVTVSTEPIQASLKERGVDSVVIPNSLVAHEWESLKPIRRSGKRPRIGWAGQAKVHVGDMAILESMIEALKHDVEWVFLGDAPRNAREAGVVSEIHPMVDLAEFPRKLASLNLDLALAPLVPNAFNEAKSDIRVLQYGILGYPVIGTDILPHQQAPILRLPHDPKIWIDAIRERIHDWEAMEREGNELRKWVLTHRLIEHVLPKYEQVWLGREPSLALPDTGSFPSGSLVSVSSSGSRERQAFTCSIIIPVCNKVELTRQCLTHLAEVTEGCAFEVIVVDNASTDGTKEFLSTLEGDVQVVSNPENYGFAKACNQGAAAAKGRFLVFLNNDTIPQRGWLQALVDEVEHHTDTAIVGSKLLFPDGTIQHAGVVFSKNCLTPYHLFRGAPGDLKAADVRREFQVVTAACMLVCREDFEAVGGFDEIYRNGFEDVDLCLKIGKRGRKIVYQPRSVLYHLEHQTPGRKDSEAERHNGRVLMERWASSIVVDEDLYTVPEGYANRYYFRDGWLRQLLEPFRDEVERSQWERVRTLQELLLRKQKQGGTLDRVEDSRLIDVLRRDMEWPADGEVLRWGALVCRSLNMIEEESRFWERVVALREDIEGRESLAKLRLGQGHLDEASRHIHAILSGQVHHAGGHFLKGILCMQRGQYSEAIPAFQQALTGGGESDKARRGLAMAYWGAGNFEQAWNLFRQAYQAHPDDSENVKHLLQVGTALKCWQELDDVLGQYLERNPADCDIRFALAGVQFRAGQIELAQQQYLTLATLKPDYEGLQDLQVLLESSTIPHGAQSG